MQHRDEVNDILKEEQLDRKQKSLEHKIEDARKRGDMVEARELEHELLTEILYETDDDMEEQAY